MTDHMGRYLTLRNIKFLMSRAGLWKYVIEVDMVSSDRIYVKLNPDIFNDLIQTGSDHWKEVYPIHPSHAKLGEFYFGPNLRDAEGIMDGYISFRQKARPSLQITMLGEEVGKLVADIDVDLGNPVMDIVGGITHLLEVLFPGKTDHNKLHKKLAKKYGVDFTGFA